MFSSLQYCLPVNIWNQCEKQSKYSAVRSSFYKSKNPDSCSHTLKNDPFFFFRNMTTISWFYSDKENYTNHKFLEEHMQVVREIKNQKDTGVGNSIFSYDLFFPFLHIKHKTAI